MFLKVAVLVSLLVCLTAHINAQTQADRELISQLFNNGQYDRRVRPVNTAEKKGQVVVKVNMYVRSVTNLDNNEFDVQLTFRQKWKDERLVYRSDNSNKYLNLINPVNLTWVPDTFFSNEKEGQVHNLLARNEYVRVWPDGNVLYSVRISLKLACNMDFRNFPLDRQTCQIRLASYGYTNEDIEYDWDERDPIQFPKNLNLPSHNLEKHFTTNCDSTTNTGTYSCLQVEFTFKRIFTTYLINIYIPCVTMIIVAYLSFWMNVRAITARTVLLITTLLVLGIQASSISRALPQTGYTKAVDWWTGMSLTFVFVALVEFIIVQYIANREERSCQVTDVEEQVALKADNLTGESKEQGGAQSKIICVIQKYVKDLNSLSDKLDGAFRVGYPIAYVIFVIAYTIAYCPSSE